MMPTTERHRETRRLLSGQVRGFEQNANDEGPTEFDHSQAGLLRNKSDMLAVPNLRGSTALTPAYPPPSISVVLDPHFQLIPAMASAFFTDGACKLRLIQIGIVFTVRLLS